jgi:hypothetical protein
MPTRDQIRGLVEHGEDYAEIGESFKIPPGQAYLIGTGSVADGSSATRPADAVLGTRAQALVNPREMTESLRGDVHAWVRRLAYSDSSMRPSGGRP